MAITPGFRTEGFIPDTISIVALKSAPMVRIQMDSNGWGFQDLVLIQVIVLEIESSVMFVTLTRKTEFLVGVRIVLVPLLKIVKELWTNMVIWRWVSMNASMLVQTEKIQMGFNLIVTTIMVTLGVATSFGFRNMELQM